MDTKDTLLAFSEWLDGEGFFGPATTHDQRTHEELALEFIDHWGSNPRRATLAGQEPLPGTEVPEAPRVDKDPRLGCATTQELIGELSSRAEVSRACGETWPTYRTVDSQ